MLGFDEVKPGDCLIYQDECETVEVQVTAANSRIIDIESKGVASFLIPSDFENGHVTRASHPDSTLPTIQTL